MKNNGDTALHFALGCGHYKVADRLVVGGTSQNAKNAQGKTAWDLMRR
jgi:ankyrin repeat protein